MISIARARLNKEERNIQESPIENVLVARHNERDFHFVIYNLEDPYGGGFYHALLQMHEKYPHAAPKLFFFTPSGRFQINIPICTSFTNYHQESWSPAWNLRSLVIGVISFMLSQESSFGCRSDSFAVRRNMAVNSMKFNLRSNLFVNLFKEELIKKGLINELQVAEPENLEPDAAPIPFEEQPFDEQRVRLRRIKSGIIIAVVVIGIGLGMYFSIR